ncbi:hypothetical protein OG455_34545 [Kitasatospora sp. NBC_01287]|uniref:hypothetical protein n=1 Tax=Kitasatospora sp. NBC_01287 TaxID=2903573 RepID=UPI00225B10DB|nr:hypothetical protein [Kitasatospora sp. NBC_01287]MCX4750570.1 hypothetical protein [Kitasatospora sp. NBC_01287]
MSTTALALAAAWPGERRPLVVEADAAGGDALLRFGLRESPGLVSLAAASRRAGLSAALIGEHAQRLPGGVDVVVAPAESAQCAAALDALGPAWAEAEVDGALLIVDCGRLGPRESGTEALLRSADAVLLVTGGAVEALAHTAEAAARLRSRAGCLVVAVVGPCAWPAAEVEAALGADLCRLLPHDSASAALLRGRPEPKRRWFGGPGRPLLGAAGQLAREIDRRLPERQAAEDSPLWEPSSVSGPGDLASVLGGERA